MTPTVLLALSLLLAACGGAVAPTSSAGPSTAATPVLTPEPSSGSPDETQPGSEPPAETPPPEDTPLPTETEPPSDPPIGSGDPEITPEPSGGPSAACAGSESNRLFYERVAQAVDWAVLCPVLPTGWYISAGSYRLANGGKLVIGYKGADGATLDLSEGSFCADAGGCVPPGADAGDAMVGPLAGTLVRLDDGGFALVADRGMTPSWLLVAHGLDETATIELGAAMLEVLFVE